MSFISGLRMQVCQTIYYIVEVNHQLPVFLCIQMVWMCMINIKWAWRVTCVGLSLIVESNICDLNSGKSISCSICPSDSSVCHSGTMQQVGFETSCMPWAHGRWLMGLIHYCCLTSQNGKITKSADFLGLNRRFKSQPRKINMVENWCLSLLSLALNINKDMHGLVSSIPGQHNSMISGYSTSSLISQWDNTIKLNECSHRMVSVLNSR